MEKWPRWLICSLLIALLLITSLWLWEEVKGPVGRALGTLLGLLVALPILWSLAIIITAIRRRRARPMIRVELFPATEKPTLAEQDFVCELQNALARLQGRIAFLERHLAFRDEGLSYFFNYDQLLSEAEGLYPDVDMEWTIGPVKVGDLMRLLSTRLGRREFLLQIRVSTAANETYLVDSRLSLNGQIWYVWPRQTVASRDMALFCANLVHELVWLTSLPHPSKASDLYFDVPPEIHLLKATDYLVDSLQSAKPFQSLDTALAHLQRAGRGPSALYSELLHAILVDRAQRSPKEAVQLMRQLLERYGVHGLRGTTLLYNYGVATFHQYETVETAYDEAIGIFRRISRPTWQPSWTGRDVRYDWLLYLLAQAGIANCLAHQLRKAHARDRKLLLQRMRTLNATIREDLARKRLLLGSLADEVEWRLWNAEAVSIYFTKGAADEGLACADQGLLIDRQNLPLRANQGSLFLLKYLQASDEDQKQKSPAKR